MGPAPERFRDSRVAQPVGVLVRRRAVVNRHERRQRAALVEQYLQRGVIVAVARVPQDRPPPVVDEPSERQRPDPTREPSCSALERGSFLVGGEGQQLDQLREHALGIRVRLWAWRCWGGGSECGTHFHCKDMACCRT